MKIGYARVSTDEQNLRMQIDALEAAGAEKIFEDRGISGSAVIKPALRECLEFARDGDELVVWRLDRLSRSLKELIELADALGQRNLAFRSLHEQIETVSPAGRLFFHIVGALAEFEREIIRARTRDGMNAARRAGKRLGRPPTISDEQWTEAKALMSGSDPKKPAEVARLLGVSRQAVSKRLKADREAQGGDVASTGRG
ncbi:recombinase family protein [Altericroceibacterium spongiae]|uniref:Recombinase family protein n=1 Tax=Altericroceibacterium spongiae TaxID=2320269 RepID=A0A420EAR8_9SPHN|nr:recombinase family protein [Altericroceibacterium spongiae]RKF17744.1 recombinase family protein [Altericroceibacterium spongiae]